MRILFCLMLLYSASAPAEVYKWVDEKGVIHYTDQPPAKDAQPAQLPPLQTYRGEAVPPAGNVATAPVVAPLPLEVKILSPAPEQTFRGDAEGQVSVSVAVSPALLEGQQLVYYLNGAAQGEPNPGTSYTFTGVQRGAHSIAVALLDKSGQEIARSAPITVHMKPPIIKR